MKARVVRTEWMWNTWCIYAEYKAGKTTLVAGAPRPIFLDSDQGTMSFAERPGFEKVRAVPIFTTRMLDRAYANFTATGKHRWDKKFLTLVHDRFEDIQQMALEELQVKVVERNESRDLDAIDVKEWGILGNRMARYVRRMKRLAIHKVFICGAVDGDDGLKRPHIKGGFRNHLPGLVDHTAYLRVSRSGRRYLHLDPTEDFYAGTRAWWLTPDERVIRVPHPDKDPQFLSKLFELIAAGPKGRKTHAALYRAVYPHRRSA